MSLHLILHNSLIHSTHHSLYYLFSLYSLNRSKITKNRYRLEIHYYYFHENVQVIYYFVTEKLKKIFFSEADDMWQQIFELEIVSLVRVFIKFDVRKMLKSLIEIEFWLLICLLNVCVVKIHSDEKEQKYFVYLEIVELYSMKREVYTKILKIK